MTWVDPEYPRTVVDQAGQLLASGSRMTVEEIEGALLILANWRAAHSFPLNTIQMNLRTKARAADPRALVAQRLKRMSSIVFKLERYPRMRASQMQDIGGCRAVVSTVGRVAIVRRAYQLSRSTHELVREKDYIDSPQATGYRGVHLVYRYRSTTSPQYNGLQVELQIRTRAQHAWATAVETVGIFLNESLKSNMGAQGWLDFFREASAVFAEMERTPAIPGVLATGSELRASVRRQMQFLNAEEKLTAYGHALSVAKRASSKGHHYFLLALNPRAGVLSVTGYPRRHLEEASEAYSMKEREFADIPGAEAVLVATSSMQALERAYPNYFLDTQVFLHRLNAALGVTNNQASSQGRAI